MYTQRMNETGSVARKSQGLAMIASAKKNPG
jgi:hypothetical protein